MEVMEAVTPLIFEDFEVGDRVYSLFDGKYTKGTVTTPRPGTFNAITVDMDSNWQTVVPLTGSFQKDTSTFGYWGKIPDVKRFMEGTVLSKLEDDGTRIFARVQSLIAGESLRIALMDSSLYHRDYLYSDISVLEHEFMDWEIED